MLRQGRIRLHWKRYKYLYSHRFIVFEIHPLVWRPETFGLTHQLYISNQVEIARRRGTRKLRTYQSGINEEHVLRGKGRGNRTYILFILEKYINNLSGTDGCRVLCRQFYTSSFLRSAYCISRSNNCSQAMKPMAPALLRWLANGDQGQNSRTMVYPLNTGRR